MSKTRNSAGTLTDAAQATDRLGAPVLWFALSFYFLMTLAFIVYATRLRFPVFVIGALVYGLMSMTLGLTLRRVYRRLAAATREQR